MFNFLANFDRFNSIYAVTVKEELLRSDGYCSGKCDGLESWRQTVIPLSLSYPNSCKGTIHSCWFQKETDRRKAAVDKVSKMYKDYSGAYAAYSFEKHGVEIREAEINRDHTGNDCTCLCERTLNDEVDRRGELVDSICYDPISVDNGYVATGVRFKRHGNVIHLELQQGILSGGRINPVTLKWTTANNCNSAKKVVSNFRNGGTYDGLEIILEDMTLPENAVVTGVTLGQSLRGRMINDDGDFNDNMDETVKSSQCHGSTTDLVHGHSDLLPSTSLIGRNNALSRSCEHKIIFGGTAERSDHIQHVVPYVDLQEIVTDQNSPQPIRGIGWYYRGHAGYGGFLALKIFK
ncbi:uncharacterized protein LOC130673274 [Microplitis mediator]|uniref:uncharacterized protein LOC130673274 n=1 Tax=Microplitis mediator TaxID=375433 RepID=UPI002553C1F1|nr:uncharacterized protein LOC130673274 [Microplitis mediator]